ncbi:hypothetical protein EYF80_024024 [Liparis tanakae]|uniref:Uncharacterized protein n=1 Tax=Liparis tanakae TaxID=230148 RepID=A0A4Z2HJF6_9TELE|nr:hypothetical protein EYF80_024024 [Liparis tanakae]
MPCQEFSPTIFSPDYYSSRAPHRLTAGHQAFRFSFFPGAATAAPRPSSPEHRGAVPPHAGHSAPQDG